ncbi:MAG: DNA-directed RNA polymerase subunit delta [Erysipelotrichaceae bacterium]
MKKPMIDVGFELMTKKKKQTTFLKLWEEVSQAMGLDEQQAEDNIAQFYTDIALDNRFVHMGDNKWDLRSRHTFKEVVVDTDALIIDDENDDLEYEKEEEIAIKEPSDDY